jgi:hypothetical protein
MGRAKRNPSIAIRKRDGYRCEIGQESWLIERMSVRLGYAES